MTDIQHNYETNHAATWEGLRNHCIAASNLGKEQRLGGSLTIGVGARAVPAIQFLVAMLPFATLPLLSHQ